MKDAAKTELQESERDAQRRALLAFTFHREDPEATMASVEDKVHTLIKDGHAEEAGRLMRLGMTAVRFWQMKERLRSRHAPPPPAETVPTPEDKSDPDPDPDPEPAPPPIELRPAQRPPKALPDGSDWRTWLFLGGRGAGKTRAGAEWLADQAEALGAGGRLALIGPTLHDVREVMIEGVSGLRSLPRWTANTRPVFESSRRRLRFANGCIAYAFSAEDPDSLRGPQFSAAWADEFCAWRATGARGAAETLALLRMGLRLPLADAHPRLLVTTTPKPTRALVRLKGEASCAVTHAGTADNADHLAPGFIEGLRELYGGTRREAQELAGQIVELDGALFTAEMMMRARKMEPDGPGWERVVVAIDPPATASGDACGIIAAGSRLRADGVREAVVLADRSAHGLSPEEWARRAVALAREVRATCLVAEVNQGGDMVASVLKAVDRPLPLRAVRATRGKVLRAEPVAALYEQGRVKHAGMFEALEEELMAMGSELGEGSLDRADALVWAVTDLLIDRPGERGPRVRAL